jgi:hypothetical protein
MHSPVLRKAATLGTAILLVVGLTLLSLWRQWPHPDTGTIAHRITHVGAFWALGLLVLPLGRSRGQICLAAAVVFAVALALELLQYHSFQQPFEWWDVRDNGVGLLLALLAVRFARFW